MRAKETEKRKFTEEALQRKNERIGNALRGREKDNPFNWALRKLETEGVEPLYRPHELLAKFEDYVDYIDNQPLYEAVLHQKSGSLMHVPKMRAMSIQGFSVFCGMTSQTFLSYEKKLEYKHICSAIRDVMYSQKFEGAAAGLLNSNLISRDLGLRESVDLSVAETKKTISELFPEIEDIDAIVVNDTKELPYGGTRIDTIEKED